MKNIEMMKQNYTIHDKKILGFVFWFAIESLLEVDGLSHLTIYLSHLTLFCLPVLCLCARLTEYQPVLKATAVRLTSSPNRIFKTSYTRNQAQHSIIPYTLSFSCSCSCTQHKASNVFSIQYLCYEYCIFHLMRFITRLH